MKGVKTWLKFLALFAMPLLCLCQSSDVNALKHQYYALPYFSNTDLYGTSFHESLSFSGLNAIDSSSSFSFSNTKYPIYFFSQKSSATCVYSGNGNSLITWQNGAQISFTSYYKTFNGTNDTNEPYTHCMRVGYQFGDDPVLPMSWDSLPPYIFGNPDYRSLNPYYYDYSHFYLNDNYIDTDSGIHYTNQLSGKQLLGSEIHSFYEMKLPLEFVQTNIGQVSSGRSLEFQGVFDFSDQSFEWGFGSGSRFEIEYRGQTESQLGTQDYTQGTIECTANFRQLEAINFAQLEYSCPWESPVTFAENALGFTLIVNAGDGQYVWRTDGDLHWAGLYVITDHDDTPGAPANSTPTGNNLSDAPGSAEGLAIAAADGDWFSSLTNLFFWSFINPFAPIFNLFTDQNSCASIPTIASMIHSEETTVCPWFDSTTRNITTPVLGLASAMLVFGFAVRWLGGSSGNFLGDNVNADNIDSFDGRPFGNNSMIGRFRRKH